MKRVEVSLLQASGKEIVYNTIKARKIGWIILPQKGIGRCGGGRYGSGLYG